MPFISHLHLKSIRGSDNYWVSKSLDYQCEEFLIRVPVGTRTDFASIPRICRWYIDDDGARIRDAAVVHDFLYSTCSDAHFVFINRAAADRVLRSGMEDLGASWFKCFIVYWSVRLFGRSHYKE